MDRVAIQMAGRGRVRESLRGRRPNRDRPIQVIRSGITRTELGQATTFKGDGFRARPAHSRYPSHGVYRANRGNQAANRCFSSEGRATSIVSLVEGSIPSFSSSQVMKRPGWGYCPRGSNPPAGDGYRHQRDGLLRGRCRFGLGRGRREHRSTWGAGGTDLWFRPVRLRPAAPRPMAFEPSGVAGPVRAESGALESSASAAGVEAVATLFPRDAEDLFGAAHREPHLQKRR